MTWSMMSIEEIALGLALESDPNHPPPELPPETRRPQQVLEEILLGALSRSRVAVAFSGGVDSSGLLCLAAHVARTHGLPDPIAVTCRFPQASATSWPTMCSAARSPVTLDFTSPPT
jgi:asparagine synthetase B (glutamine-hydrolysing)